MIAHLLAQHVPFIRNYLDEAPVAGPDADVPDPSPAPPDEPIPFAVESIATIDLLVDELISPDKEIATVVTAESAALIDPSVSVPGCTFNVVGDPVDSITMDGTPTDAGVYRTVLTYLRDDGSNTVLGSSTHTITILDPTVLFDAGDCVNYSGRAGQPVDVELCAPEIAMNIEVTAHPDTTVPGTEIVFEWTAGATSSGTVTLLGTPTTEAESTLTITYRAGVRVLGTSVHEINITAASDVAPPAPAPAPPPAPPVPAPEPDPAPAPEPPPIPAADPLFSDVILLHRFDALDATATEFESVVGPNFGGDIETAPGACDEAARLPMGGLSFLAPPTFDLSEFPFTLDCMVRVEDATGLWAAGAGTRATPIVSCINPGNNLLWVLYLHSYEVPDAHGQTGYGAATRRVVLKLRRSMLRYPTALKNNPVQCEAVDAVAEAPGRFTHVAAQWGIDGQNEHGVWWDGRGGSSLADVGGTGAGVPLIDGAVIRVGGSCPGLGAGVQIMPLVGTVDELRFTAAERYEFSGNLTVAITEAQRLLPWPGY